MGGSRSGHREVKSSQSIGFYVEDAELEAHGFDHVLATRPHRDEDVASVLEMANSPSTAGVAAPTEMALPAK